MKTEAEMKAYLEYQGVPFTEPIYSGVAVLRLSDMTQVPQSMREQFDERGFFVAPKNDDTNKGKKK